MEENKKIKSTKNTKKAKSAKKEKSQNKASTESTNNTKTIEDIKDINTIKKMFKNFNIKNVFYQFINFDHSAEFVFKVNKIVSMLVLCLVAISLFIVIISNLFEDLLFSVLVLLVSPIILLLTKYMLSIYLLLLDWLSASTKFYKSNIKKD